MQPPGPHAAGPTAAPPSRAPRAARGEITPPWRPAESRRPRWSGDEMRRIADASRNRAASLAPRYSSSASTSAPAGSVARVVRDDRERVRRRERAGQVRALALRRRGLQHAVRAVRRARRSAASCGRRPARTGTASRAGTTVGAAPASPCIRRSAGPTKSRKQATVESGLPGRPKTSVASAAAEPQRLAGLEPDAPEHLLARPRLERRLDVVVRADRNAAAHEQHVAGQRGLDGGARRRAVVGHDGVQDDLGARAPRRAAAASAGSTRGSAPARAARRPRAARHPVASTCTTGRRCTATVADARRRRAP